MVSKDDEVCPYITLMPVRRKFGGWQGMRDQRKEDQKEDTPISHLLSGAGMREVGENMDGGMGFPSARRAEGTRD